MKKCELIIEAIFEDLNLKRQMLAELEPHLNERCVFVSNTSALPIGDRGLPNPNPTDRTQERTYGGVSAGLRPVGAWFRATTHPPRHPGACRDPRLRLQRIEKAWVPAFAGIMGQYGPRAKSDPVRRSNAICRADIQLNSGRFEEQQSQSRGEGSPHCPCLALTLLGVVAPMLFVRLMGSPS